MSNKLARSLASNDAEERHAAIKIVRRWLKRRKYVDHEDLMKLWKGLFYCLWMTPKPAAQEVLSTRLSQLIRTMEPDRALDFLRSFYSSMSREWPGLDQHRLDKYYTLVRRVVFESFRYLASRTWDAEFAIELAEVYAQGPLSTTEASFAGLTLHVVDVFIPELSRVVAESNVDAGTFYGTFLTLMAPVNLLMLASCVPLVRRRVLETAWLPIAEGTMAIDEETIPLFSALAPYRASLAELHTENSKVLSPGVVYNELMELIGIFNE